MTEEATNNQAEANNSILSPFQWREEYSMGIDGLDDDHQTLFELFNHLRAAIKAGEKKALPWIIDDIQQYVIFHFQNEEQSMDACGYAHTENHKLVHRMFEKRIADFVSNPEFNQNIESAIWLLGFMENWLKDHITGMDRSYISCLKEKMEVE